MANLIISVKLYDMPLPFTEFHFPYNDIEFLWGKASTFAMYSTIEEHRNQQEILDGVQRWAV